MTRTTMAARALFSRLKPQVVRSKPTWGVNMCKQEKGGTGKYVLHNAVSC
jgi:hypothetical protein